MATKTNKALDNGASLIAVRDAAILAEAGRGKLIASMRESWAEMAKAKPAAKVARQRDMQQQYMIGTLLHGLCDGVVNDKNIAHMGEILRGTDATRKPKAGQHVRTAEERRQWQNAKMRWSGYMAQAGIPALNNDGTPKAKAARKARTAGEASAETDTPAKPENLAAAAPKAATAQDCVTYYQTQAATWLAYANKNAATMPAGLAGLVLDVVNKMKAFKAD